MYRTGTQVMGVMHHTVNTKLIFQNIYQKKLEIYTIRLKNECQHFNHEGIQCASV